MLEFDKYEDIQARESFRLLDEKGELIGDRPSDLTPECTLKLYSKMLELQILDNTMFEIQRQGRIPFYLTSSGEEALGIGTSSALTIDDVLFTQYRETGVFLWRGLSFEQIMNQCFSTEEDSAKGRQMPIHYSSKELNIQTVSSPLATQLPHAVGCAFALKGSGSIAVCFFGEGAASEGDFHAAMNFASTLSCPVLFICRNNGYAISTPTSEQYSGDGIVSRASGYGMASMRIDGNCVLASRLATQKAKEFILKTNKPVLLECMTYRLSHHSTSDDSSSYRTLEEVDAWEKQHPVNRMFNFLVNEGLMTKEKDEELRKSIRAEVLREIKRAEKKPKADSVHGLFEDVYSDMPLHLQEQKQELLDHLKKYPDHYKFRP